jgi:hypothetical protein
MLVVVFGTAFAITSAASHPDPGVSALGAAASRDAPQARPAAPSLESGRLREVAELPGFRGVAESRRTRRAAAARRPRPAQQRVAAPSTSDEQPLSSVPDSGTPQVPDRAPAAAQPAPAGSTPRPSPTQAPAATPAPQFDSSSDSNGDFDSSG